MKEFLLAAVADEAGAPVSEQIDALRANGMTHIELRGVGDKNVTALTLDAAKELRKQLDDGGIGVWAIGSPLGKISLGRAAAPHPALVKPTPEPAVAPPPTPLPPPSFVPAVISAPVVPVRAAPSSSVIVPIVHEHLRHNHNMTAYIEMRDLIRIGMRGGYERGYEHSDDLDVHAGRRRKRRQPHADAAPPPYEHDDGARRKRIGAKRCRYGDGAKCRRRR